MSVSSKPSIVLSRLVAKNLSTKVLTNKDKNALVKLDEELKNYSSATQRLFESSNIIAARSATTVQGYELVNSIVGDIIKST